MIQILKPIALSAVLLLPLSGVVLAEPHQSRPELAAGLLEGRSIGTGRHTVSDWSHAVLYKPFGQTPYDDNNRYRAFSDQTGR
ncbi:hypothetical protein [Beijerinckia indica]|uniref:Uncharacterized protein n=1 Tax=Beijerinckia indica subsp. indica (strain ATCC 9039 / DSM 1715 / NCIMB 8712) TaxID=395963 RepID=B2ICF5_BEII9|nr:hypothetical protein [Beijerinckia indica]ACB93844.1 hypothetical protein Bind_0188 [Beijerinckia indica subsp. indica ATCC 9039]